MEFFLIFFTFFHFLEVFLKVFKIIFSGGEIMKYPFEKQTDLKDCGVCCLASIIKHYKGNVPLEKIRLDAKTTVEGTTALNLILASTKYGFEATGVKLNSVKDIKQFPAIAHMNLKKGYSHYVVIEKITKDKIIIMDPAKGKVVKKINEFMEEWSKVIILFYPKRKIIVLKK